MADDTSSFSAAPPLFADAPSGVSFKKLRKRLVRGALNIDFACDCARCLEPFTYTLELAEWTCVLPLKGPDAVETKGEYLDLTPWVREDILLGLPQHPLCGSACQGLVLQQEDPPETDADEPSADWSKLDEW
ncbi:YceD family protein, partial [uncultured Hyphomonas sp.]|uniref:YceD family protein n=1 Tax=uncultured Hyphomonas sp. TaxID=225298 RepID=UPI00261C991A